ETAGTIRYDDWDLAFEGSTDGWKIILNDARMMSALATQYSAIANATDSAGFGSERLIEVSATAYTMPAMGDWRNIDKVYLIDLCSNSSGQSPGIYWQQVLAVNQTTYTIRTKKYGQNEIQEAIIAKRSDEGFTRYSVVDNNSVPGFTESSWDIMFTKYTYNFIEPPQPYLVTGLILNPNRTAAVEITDRPFEEINLADTTGLNWSYQPDFIGYDWKYYDFNAAIYQIDSDRTWIIRTASGFYYKFRFTDFYDQAGHAGVPNFEFGKI